MAIIPITVTIRPTARVGLINEVEVRGPKGTHIFYSRRTSREKRFKHLGTLQVSDAIAFIIRLTEIGKRPADFHTGSRDEWWNAGFIFWGDFGVTQALHILTGIGAWQITGDSSHRCYTWPPDVEFTLVNELTPPVLPE